MNQTSNPWPLPATFFEAVKAIEPFSDSVYFAEKCLKSHSDDKEGASFEIEGLPVGPIFANKYLKMIEGMVQSADFSSHKNMAFFFGDNFRAVIMGRIF